MTWPHEIVIIKVVYRLKKSVCPIKAKLIILYMYFQLLDNYGFIIISNLLLLLLLLHCILEHIHYILGYRL